MKAQSNLSHFKAHGPHACALVLQCSIKMIKDKPQFKHGITRKEMIEYFPRLMGFSLATYGNRMRDNCNIHKTMQRHDVHGIRHFYPVILDEQGLICHDNCSCKMRAHFK